ncbi:MAG: MerR family transcriptional regulator [Candidatus Eremiobacteraeota bacterium]|nr:MerR family transcriptional regulator [Candidatus Eremiobacteraeota bacterium]
MPRKIVTGSQLPLFPEDLFYVSQSDAAKHLGITTRLINYWESQELLHPELQRKSGTKARKYTPNDMVELRFIKGMVVDQGYAIPSLKEKLEFLEAPYYYNPEDMFWDLKEKQWKSRDQIAAAVVKKSEKKLRELFARLAERFEVPGGEREEFLLSLFEAVKSALGKP